MLKQTVFAWAIASCIVLGVQQNARAGLINGSFETTAFPGNSVHFPFAPAVPGWSTTASDNRIEIWSNGFNGVVSYDQNQHAELNAFFVSTLYQDAVGIPAGSIVGWQFAHHSCQHLALA